MVVQLWPGCLDSTQYVLCVIYAGGLDLSTYVMYYIHTMVEVSFVHATQIFYYAIK